MELDWFTLIAQVVNLLVLVALLKHFLFGRIVRAMGEREATIAGRLDDAARRRASAEEEAELFRGRRRELEEQREQMLAQARKEAESLREELMDAARLETESAQLQWLEALQRERQALLQDFREKLGQAVFTLASQGLKELANADLEEQVLKVFVERLQALDPAKREEIVAAVRDSDFEVEIRTAFPVTPQTREGLSRCLREHLDDSVDVRFTTAPELICGIELRVPSHRIVWNLDSYLEGVQARVFEGLDESARKHAHAAP
jgi:F-type H+-transporting ATPase subunit b